MHLRSNLAQFSFFFFFPRKNFLGRGANIDFNSTFHFSYCSVGSDFFLPFFYLTWVSFMNVYTETYVVGVVYIQSLILQRNSNLFSLPVCPMERSTYPMGDFLCLTMCTSFFLCGKTTTQQRMWKWFCKKKSTK